MKKCQTQCLPLVVNMVIWDGVKNWITGNYEQTKLYEQIGLGEYVDNFMKDLNNKIVEFIVDQITSISDLLINLMLELPLKIMNLKGFQELYLFITKITLVIIGPVVMYFGFNMIIGKISDQELWESIKRYLFLPFFVVCSPVIIKRAIFIVNKISNILLNSTQSQFLYYPKELEPELIFLAIIYAIYLMKILLWYSTRNIKLIYLIIVSPLLYLLWSFPGKFEKFGDWIHEITSLLFTQVAHIIQLLILLMITNTSMGGFEELVTQVGALILMTQTESWLSGYFESNQIKLPKFSSYTRPMKKVWNKIRR